MAFENYDDIRQGDMIECFEILEVARTVEANTATKGATEKTNACKGTPMDHHAKKGPSQRQLRVRGRDPQRAGDDLRPWRDP